MKNVRAKILSFPLLSKESIPSAEESTEQHNSKTSVASGGAIHLPQRPGGWGWGQVISCALRSRTWLPLLPCEAGLD